MEHYKKINSISLNEAKNLLSKDLAYLTLKNGDIVVVDGLDNSEFDKKKRKCENWSQSQNMSMHNISNTSNERRIPYVQKNIIKVNRNINVRNDNRLNIKNKLDVDDNIKLINNSSNKNYHNFNKNISQINKPIKTNKSFNKGSHFFSPNTYSFNNCSFYESNIDKPHFRAKHSQNYVIKNSDNQITPYNLKNQNDQNLNYTICKINFNNNNSFINGNKSNILGADNMNYEIIPLKSNNENLTINKSINYSHVKKNSFNNPVRNITGFPNRFEKYNNNDNNDKGKKNDNSGKHIFRIIKNRDNHIRSNNECNVVSPIHSKYELKIKSPTSRFFNRNSNNNINNLNRYLIKSIRNNQGSSNNYTYVEIYNLNKKEK